MTTYPLALPSYAATDTDFQLTNVDSNNTLTSGQGFSTEIGSPFWNVTINLRNMANREEGYWDAFFDKLRGTKKSFLMYDANRPNPIDCPSPLALNKAGGGAFPGYGDIVSFTDVRTVNVQHMPANLQLRAGDYISFVESSRYSLHRVSDDCLGDGGGVITIPYEPWLNTDFFDTSAKLWIYHPMGEFILKLGSTPNRARNIEAKPVSFAAVSRVQ